MGLDPGANVAGFVVLEALRPDPFLPRDFKILDAGALRTVRDMTHAEKIGAIHEAVFTLAEQWMPDVCVIEKAFAGVNIQSALRIGEARGALVAALRRLKVPVAEITPATVKKTIAGNGAATKETVYQALRLQIHFELGNLPYDVSDAVAIGISYGISRSFAQPGGARL